MSRAAALPARPAPSSPSALQLGLARMILALLLRDAVLTVAFRNGAPGLTAGRGDERFAILADDPATFWTMVCNPDPSIGETYMDGRWAMTQGDLGAFITALGRNAQRLLRGPLGPLVARSLRRPLSTDGHGQSQARENVRVHYDIGNDLYATFLDEGWNYSCAFFTAPGMTLRDAQLNKLRTTIRRLGVGPGMQVLDIGCGWGELTRLIATEAGADATGVTLAENQLAVARERAADLGGQAQYLLEDYRDHAARHPGAYDRIVSVGMFEHVGTKEYANYFAAIARQLAPGGRALVHSIMNAEPTTTDAKLTSVWLQRYIFPGGELPDLQEMLDAAATAGLEPDHAPYLQPPSDYAETLRRWRANFNANAHRLDPAKYDDRFRRMWNYYFAMCEGMFDGVGFQVGQVVFRRKGEA